MNLASALTAGFSKDINIDQETINLGNQLMYMGNVVLEIPSNMLMQQVSLISSREFVPPIEDYSSHF